MPQCSRLEAELIKEVARYKSCAFAPKTQQSYAAHRRSYLRFCSSIGRNPIHVPATSQLICCYAAFLARRLKYQSIKQYLNIIRIMHREWELPNPLEHNFSITQTLRGVRRTLGDQCKSKWPITPVILQKILQCLDLHNPFDANMWAVCLVLFYGLLRKASVLRTPNSRELGKNVLLRSDISFSTSGALLNIRHSKTIQFGERTLKIPLPRFPGSPLCPVQALFRALRSTKNTPSSAPAFCVPRGRSWSPLTATQFDARLRQCLSAANLPEGRFSGHSFRRGGATWAYSVGVPVEVIRAP